MLPATYQIPATLVLLLSGIIACFFGHRLFRVVLALFGFIIGALAASSVVGSSSSTYMLVAAIAGDGARMIGVAAACEETAGLWQIGVDVIPDAQGSGIGRQLVGMITQEILDAGGVPYYTAAASNIASRSTALGLGFWPAWTDLYVTDLIRSAPE